MPPKRQHEDPAALKEKLQSANPHNRRNGKTAINGSALKEVDNASQASNENISSHVSPSISLLPMTPNFPTHVYQKSYQPSLHNSTHNEHPS